jgi:hypothetical protein
MWNVSRVEGHLGRVIGLLQLGRPVDARSHDLKYLQKDDVHLRQVPEQVDRNARPGIDSKPSGIPKADARYAQYLRNFRYHVI